MTLIERLKTIMTFIGRRDNPNEVTAAQAGAYSKSETDQRLNQKIPNGILPIYAFGSSDSTAIKFTTSGFNLTIPDKQPVLIYGTPFTLNPATLSASAFPNTTSYLVVELISGTPRYSLYANKPKDTNTCINIGTVTCNGTAITSAVIKKERGIIASEAV